MRVFRKIWLFFIFFSVVNPSFASPATNKNVQFDFLSFIKKAYESYNKVKNFLDPDSNLADLILQAKQEILDEINTVRTEEQIANVEALIEEYTIYLNNPPSRQTIEAWIRDAINAANQFETIIESPDKSPRISYLCARSYNMLIPLMALMMQRHGIQTEDIVPLLNDAIATNKVLIGNYCWDDLPNVPIYWNVVYVDGTFVGKLLKCYHEGTIDWTEYQNTYDIVVTANEECRKITIEGYEEMWFYISNEKAFTTQPISPEDNQYLCAHSRPNRTETEVTVEDLRPGDTDFLWRLEFQTGHLAKIMHWSGKYLAIATHNEPNTSYRDALLTSKPDWQNEYWYFQTEPTLYHDRVAIISNVKPDDYSRDPLLTTDSQNNVYLQQRPPTYPNENQRWIIHFAVRKALGIGYSAFPCPSDYDGDSKMDLGMKINDGHWLIDVAENGFGSWDLDIHSWTLPSIHKYTQPAPADYDGDGKADIAVKDDLTEQWCIDYAANGFGSWDFRKKITSAGEAFAYYPLAADYDGDGKADIALCSKFGGWSIDYSSDGFTGWDTYPHAWDFYYPDANLYPAPADYDGDGKTDVSIKLDDGRWLIDFANNDFDWTNNWDWTSFSGVNYGDKTGQPLPGYYYQSDLYADLGVRTDEGRWLVDYAFGGLSVYGIDWISDPIYGSKNDIAIPADYDGDGVIDLSVIKEDGTWSIDFSADGYHGWNWTSTMSITTDVSSFESGYNRQFSRIREFSLANYPNPFNLSTTIHFDIIKPGLVIINIYNVLGVEVTNLLTEIKEVGEYCITWNGKDRYGRSMPSGIYVCQMRSQYSIKNIKMLLMK